MKQKIITAILKLLRLIKYWFWEEPIKELPPEEKYRLKLTDVAKEYVVLKYHGQMINLHKSEIPLWNANSRYDKRATAKRFEVLEKKGLIRFVEIDGKWITIKNRDYESKENVK